MRLLFQGDSITDCQREREVDGPGDPLGHGYPSRIARSFTPEQDCETLNRGISGNRIVDLYARWKIDTLILKPDVISILAGVNDTWHEKKYGNGVEVDRYAQIYRLLLEWTLNVLPNVKLVLCEPFVLPCGKVTSEWRPEIDARGEVVEKLARDFGAIFVPFQSEFDKALTQHPADYWAADGIHPTPSGHELMASCWLRHAGSLIAKKAVK